MALKDKLKKACQLRTELKNVDAETLSNCFIEKLNGNITIGEYFSEDYFEVPKIKKIVVECIGQSGKLKKY
jgi:hypothetical protein